MEAKVFLIICIYAVFINNFVLSRPLGLSPFWGAAGKINYPLSMGCVVICIMTLTSFGTHLVYQYLLKPYEAIHLHAVSFMLVIVIFTVCIDAIITKIASPLYQALGFSLPVVLANCAVLGGALLYVNAGFTGRHYTLLESAAQCLGGAIGFTIVLAIMAGIRERLELADVPGYLCGLPILFITMGLLSLAFLGFSGMIL